MGELTTFNSKIYQYSDKLTANEEGIAHYILTHPKDVSRMRIEELENKLYVSKSSIVRFCKKLGYTGFIELKNSLKSELIESEDVSINTTFQHLEYLINDYKILLNRFLKFIDENDIEMLTNEIKKSGYIYIYGFDHAFLSAQEFALRLKRLGFKAEAITQKQTLRTVIGNMESDELLILLTHECKNSDVMDIVIFTNKLNINTFLISVY
ncbi:MurR/RpiR family transcriptional regulator, partial [Alkalibacterium sp. 20]|uniref:MurR/RpiR family transcriptional regulator n=1 Tax=Alkalibacterium sp. 20 TaxID=1798803 RepID=UPI0008FFFFFF